MQNLSEFYKNVTSKMKKPMDEMTAYFIVTSMNSLPNWKVLKFNEYTIEKAIMISIQNNIHYWDALIIATMQENNISKILTENEKDFKLEGIEVINPFRKF